MKISHLALSFLLISSCLLWSCGGESTTTGSPPQSRMAEETPAVQENPEQVAREKIINILSDYYTDIAAEKLDADKYFAPEVEQFFGSKGISREKVGQSLKSGFETVEDRHITFDPSTLRITPTADGYESVFSGQTIHKRSNDGQQVNASFKNKVRFNKEFQIIAYAGADDKQTQNTRGLAPREEVSAPSGVSASQSLAKQVLEEFKSGSFSRSKALIHPEYGFYLIGQPGAYSVPYHLTSFDDIFSKAPWLEKGTDMYTDLKEEAIPNFTCEGDNYFDKDGCFIAPAKNFDNLSSLMRALRQAEFDEFGPAVINKAVNIEKLVKVEVVETKSGMAYYYGEDAGKWYLLIIDMASYGCSA